MAESGGMSREGIAWAASRAIEAELDLDPEASSEEIAARALSITRPDVQEALLLGLLEQTVSPVSGAALGILCALTQNSPLLLMKSPQALAAPVA